MPDALHPPPRHLLLIEDNAEARELLRALLELEGHRVDVAADGRHGLRLALANPPEIALIDLGLPDLDGFQVAAGIRASHASQRVMLVALTGYGRAEERRRARDAGFDAHLVKPVDVEQLMGLIAWAAPR